MAREIVAERIVSAVVLVLTRAMADTGLCCAGGAPLCEHCAPIVEDMRRDVLGVVATMPDDAIDRLATAPSGVLEEVVRGIVEPDFRKRNAHRFVS